MARYKLLFKTSVTKDFRHIPIQDVATILRRIEALADDPRPNGCEKLSGLERYRVRQGSYRIIYEIIDNQLVVTVVKIGHRREVYKRLAGG
jgi:mRNA interferase RelE/StbE